MELKKQKERRLRKSKPSFSYSTPYIEQSKIQENHDRENKEQKKCQPDPKNIMLDSSVIY